MLLWQRPWAPEAGQQVRPLAADASTQLDEMLRTMSGATSQEDFVTAAGPGGAAERFATEAWLARAELGVGEVELRLVGRNLVPDRSDGSARAVVEASWTVEKDSVVAGTRVRDATIALRVEPAGDDGVAIRSAERDRQPVPLWLAGRIDVERADGVQVVRVDGGDPDLAVVELATTARATAAVSLPDVEGELTIVSPPTQARAADLLGRSEEDVERIAAVTTTVDGTTDTARVIVLNPGLFESMDERAAQVVVSHEAVHQLTGVVGTDVETWVAEGFADWVALREDDAPLGLSAGQVLRQVQEDGPPARLPTAEDFAAAEHGLGAVYEGAWMVFRMLEEQGTDPDDVVAFYEAVLGGEPAATAAERDLDVTLEQLTRQWQDYLTKSVSTVS